MMETTDARKRREEREGGTREAECGCCEVVDSVGLRELVAAADKAVAEAEQRGAVKALREAASALNEAPVLRREELRLWRWLRDRADRLAGESE